MRSNTILIVAPLDQDPELNTTFLNQPDIRLVCSDQDERALEAARRERPELILGEIGASGVELCRSFKDGADTGHIPLIVVTRSDLVTDLEHVGAELLLAKPVVPRELYEAVNGFVPLPNRSHRRYEINLRFTFEIDGRTVQVFSRNISLNGALLKTDRAIPTGTHLQVCFYLPGADREICCGARVVHSTKATRPSRVSGGVAVEFEGIDDRDLSAFEEFIERSCVPRYRRPRILSSLF